MTHILGARFRCDLAVGGIQGFEIYFIAGHNVQHRGDGVVPIGMAVQAGNMVAAAHEFVPIQYSER